MVDGHAVVAGRERFLADWALTVPDGLQSAEDAAEADGRTPILVGWDGTTRAIVVVNDAIKPTSAEALSQLRSLGLRPVLLTGDNAPRRVRRPHAKALNPAGASQARSDLIGKDARVRVGR